MFPWESIVVVVVHHFTFSPVRAALAEPATRAKADYQGAQHTVPLQAVDI